MSANSSNRHRGWVDASPKQGGTFDTDGIKAEISELEQKTTENGFWDDPETATGIQKRIASLKKRLEFWDTLAGRPVSTVEMTSDNGRLSIDVPAFARDIAFKIRFSAP